MHDVSGKHEQLAHLEPWEAEHTLGFSLPADRNMKMEFKILDTAGSNVGSPGDASTIFKNVQLSLCFIVPARISAYSHNISKEQCDRYHVLSSHNFITNNWSELPFSTMVFGH